MHSLGHTNGNIAKNTLLLYFRQLFTMVVYLYTSRVVLKALGFEDYGLYNVVGGVVTMFTFLTSSMSSASQRFFAFELVKGDNRRLNETFSLLFLSYIILTIITVLLIESTAIWFLNNKMNIPEGRLYAANVVLQFSILTYVANVFSAPYLSVLIAYEKMDIYAYFSILDAILKLVIVYFIAYATVDKLILYSFLLFCSTCIVTLCFKFYCKKKYEECHYIPFYNKERLVEIISFAWWNLLGSLSNLLRNHGVNLLISFFFNPAVNAARGIACQVNGAISSFASNFYTSVRPQITKSYASGEVGRMRNLIYVSSRLAFYLLLFFSLPIFLHVEQVLTIWLGSYPDFTAIFVKIILVYVLFDVFSMPLVAGLQATGKIRTYQLIVSVIKLLNIPISYFFLKKGFSPECTIYVNLALVIICLIPRVALCRTYYRLEISKYLWSVLIRCWFVALICYFVGLTLVSFIKTGNEWFDLFACFMSTFGIILFFVYLFGITSSEKIFLYHFIQNKLSKHDISA